MAVVPADLVTQWSTMFETLFQTEYNTSVAVDRETINKLVKVYPFGDHMGNTLQIDWLGGAPQLQVWEDEKKAAGLLEHPWSCGITRYQASIEVDLDAFRDARFNPYQERIQEMSQNAGRLWYNQISKLIQNGGAAKCYDGSNFFDTTHSEGASGNQANTIAGSGVTAANLKDDYYKAYTALIGFKDDVGQPMGATAFRPLVWIPNAPGIVEAFEDLRAALLISNTTNVLSNRFDLVVDPSLTDQNDWFMFRTDRPTKPFINLDREQPNYEDNFASMAGAVFEARKGKASVVARQGFTYGMWQTVVRITN